MLLGRNGTAEMMITNRFITFNFHDSETQSQQLKQPRAENNARYQGTPSTDQAKCRKQDLFISHVHNESLRVSIKKKMLRALSAGWVITSGADVELRDGSDWLMSAQGG